MTVDRLSLLTGTTSTKFWRRRRSGTPGGGGGRRGTPGEDVGGGMRGGSCREIGVLPLAEERKREREREKPLR